MEITEFFCCLDQKLGIQFCRTKNTRNSAQLLLAGGQGVLRKHIVILENLCKYRDTCGKRSSNVGIHGNTVGNAYVKISNHDVRFGKNDQ